MRGGEKNEEMLVISASSHGSGHHDDILIYHDFYGRLVGLFGYSKLAPLRYSGSGSVILAEL